MLKYEDQDLPCPTLSISKLPQDFLRTSLAYAASQHEYSQGYITQPYIIVVDRYHLGLFLNFWDRLNEGINWFECDFRVAGIGSTKKVRFNNPHRIDTIALNLFRVSCSIEAENPLLHSLSLGCPLPPDVNIYPDINLYPC